MVSWVAQGPASPRTVTREWAIAAAASGYVTVPGDRRYQRRDQEVELVITGGIVYPDWTYTGERGWEKVDWQAKGLLHQRVNY